MSTKKEKIIFIDLPKKTEDISISIVFQYGYYDETDQVFGLGHLLEHLLVDKLQKNLGTKEVYGSISDTDIRFDIESTKKKVSQDLENGLETILNPVFDDKSLINKEEARIRIELYEKYNDFYTWTNTKVLETLIKSPSFLKRNRTDQIKNIKNAQPSKLERRHKIIIRSPLVIFISGYKLTPSYKKTLSNLILKKIRMSTPKRGFKKIKAIYEKNKVTTVKHPVVGPDYIEQSIIFPAFSLTDSLSDRFALGFLCQELKRKLDISLGEIGVYKTSYDYKIRENYGFVRFFSFIPKKERGAYLTKIFDEIQNILNNLTQKEINKFQTGRRKGLQKDWRSNSSRIDWVIDDMLDFGSIQNLQEIKKELMKITPSRVKKVAKKVFDRSKMSTLTIKSK